MAVRAPAAADREDDHFTFEPGVAVGHHFPGQIRERETKRRGRLLDVRVARRIRRFGNALRARLAASDDAIVRRAVQRHGKRAVGGERRLEQVRPLTREVAEHQLAVLPVPHQRADVAVDPQDGARHFGARLTQKHVPGARVARSADLLRVPPHLPAPGERRRVVVGNRRRDESAHPDILRLRALALVPVGADQGLTADPQFERGVEEVVVERDRVGRDGSRRGSNLPIALEEESLGLAAAGRNLEAERHLGATRDDDGVPQAVERSSRLDRGSRPERRRGDDERSREQQSLHGSAPGHK